MSWTPEQLARVDAARELEIAVRRADGTLRPWTPIWVVHVDGDVYVRIEDVGVGPSGLREDVDGAYRDKYGSGGSTGNMVADEAAATTLRLLRE